MKRIFTKALCLVCAGALALSLAACGGKADSAASSTASSSALGSASDYDYQNFNYSDGLDEKGYWEGIRALDYVTRPKTLHPSPSSARTSNPPARKWRSRSAIC